jgi:predicted DNA-binding transcriptional regulator AlpA
MLIPIDDVLSLIPVSRATLYREMQRNDFPKPVRMGRRVMWDSDEIASWVESRKDLREEAV